MGWLKILSYVPMIIQLMVAIERIVTGAKMGEMKKELVMGVIRGIVDGVVNLGLITKDEGDSAVLYLSDIVDSVVGFMNDAGVFKHAEIAAAKKGVKG